MKPCRLPPSVLGLSGALHPGLAVPVHPPATAMRALPATRQRGALPDDQAGWGRPETRVWCFSDRPQAAALLPAGAASRGSAPSLGRCSRPGAAAAREKTRCACLGRVCRRHAHLSCRGSHCAPVPGTTWGVVSEEPANQQAALRQPTTRHSSIRFNQHGAPTAPPARPPLPHSL